MSFINKTDPIKIQGRKVYSGEQYLVRIAPTASQDEETNFENAGETILFFPKDCSLAKQVEQLTESYTGLPTDVIYEGKNQISGDINMTATAIGLPFLAERVLGTSNVKDNLTGIMALTSDSKFTLKPGVATDELVLECGADTKTITIPAGATIKQVAELINDEAIDISAVVIQGDDVEYTIPVADEEFNVIGFHFTGVLNNPAEYPNKVLTMVPTLGDPDWNNVLLDSPYNNFSAYQFTGVECLSLTIGYENSALTTVSGKMYGTLAKSFTGNPTEKLIDDVKNVASQTGGRTKCFINGVEATSVKKGTIGFEWVKEQDWNVNNQLYEIPRSKYNYTLNYEAMFNAQSKHFFEEIFNDGKTINSLFISEFMVNGKKCKIVSWSKYVKGTPYYPTFAPGAIAISASYNGVADWTDKESNGFMFIVEK